MQIIHDRRKDVSMEIRGKFGRNSECVLALVARTCKRLESSGVSLKEAAKLARPTKDGECCVCACSVLGEFRRECRRYSGLRL